MNLALFDLDHTLIPFDSGMAWTRHLVAQGALDAEAPERYLAFCHQYVAGTLDIHDMVRANLQPLAAFEPSLVMAWRDAFERSLAPRLPAAMRALVDAHRERGDLCAIVTATERFIAEPFARAFGIEHLVATEGERVGGRPTGAIAGLPCYRAHKVERVRQWLGTLGSDVPSTIASFERSFFYSDSAGDLPLLEAVSDPVAVRPDAALRAHAGARGWRIVDDGGA